MTRRSYRRDDTTTVPAVIRCRSGERYVVLTYPCCRCTMWVDLAQLAYYQPGGDRAALVMRCGRRYDHRTLPGRVGCDWPWMITIHPADDGVTPASLTWTA